MCRCTFATNNSKCHRTCSTNLLLITVCHSKLHEMAHITGAFAEVTVDGLSTQQLNNTTAPFQSAVHRYYTCFGDLGDLIYQYFTIEFRNSVISIRSSTGLFMVPLRHLFVYRAPDPNSKTRSIVNMPLAKD